MAFGNNEKILFTLLAALSLSALASQLKTVSVVYAFAPASTQAVMIRNLLENANKIQDKCQFVFTAKPGAGGSIAANSVLAKNIEKVYEKYENGYFEEGLISSIRRH